MFVEPPSVQPGGGPTQIEMACAILAIGVPVVARLSLTDRTIGGQRATAEESGSGLGSDAAADRVNAVTALEVEDVVLRLVAEEAGRLLVGVPVLLQRLLEPVHAGHAVDRVAVAPAQIPAVAEIAGLYGAEVAGLYGAR